MPNANASNAPVKNMPEIALIKILEVNFRDIQIVRVIISSPMTRYANSWIPFKKLIKLPPTKTKGSKIRHKFQKSHQNDVSKSQL